MNDTCTGWNRYLRLSESALQSQRIPKTTLTARTEPSKKEQKVLARLKELHSYAVLGRSNTGMPPRIDDTYDIRAVLYLDCLLDSWKDAGTLTTILHRTFPNPTVLLLRTANPMEGRMVSVALKRRSLAEDGASVVENVDSTGILGPLDEATARFWNTFGYDRLPQNDLLGYMQGMQDVILFHNLSPLLGFSPKPGLIHRGWIRSELGQLKQVDTEIRQLRLRRKDRNTPLSESTELRMLEADKKEDAQTIVNHIKELCHDQ